MRLAMICFQADGGIAHYSTLLSGAIQAKGHQVTLWTNRGYEFADSDLPFEVRKVFRRRRHYAVDMLTALLGIRKSGADVVHIQGLISPLIEMMFCRGAKLLGITPVITAHDVLPHQPKVYDEFIYKALYESCSHMIVHAEQNRQVMVVRLNIEKSRVSVIPHGDFLFFGKDAVDHVSALEFLRLKAHNKVVLFFGAIRPDKGLDYAIRAFPAVKQAHPDARLVVAGRVKGSVQEAEALYGGLVRSCGVADSTIMRFGYVPLEDVPRYFEAADIVVLPYIESSQSGLIQLAYACKRAVIATAVGGLPEQVEDGVTGTLVQPGNVEDLSRAIIDRLNKPEETAAMGLTAYEKASTDFSWESIAETTVEVYRKLVPMTQEERE